MTPRAVGYIRVSTDQQADRGVSLAAQQEKIRAMAVVHSAEVADIISDRGESAKSLERPGMEQLLGLVHRRDVDLVIVARLDRLTRSVKDLAELLELFQRRGVALISVAESLDTGSAAGRLVLNIMTSVSQWEREAIGERTRDALAHKKAAGRVYGSVPLGFKRDGDSLTENTEERRVVERIRGWRKHGWSLRRIAEELNRLGAKTKKGRQWYASTVSYILGNDLYETA